MLSHLYTVYRHFGVIGLEPTLRTDFKSEFCHSPRAFIYPEKR